MHFPSEQTPTQLPALPSADDSIWVASSDSGGRRLVLLRSYVDAGRIVWWRRGEIYRGPFRGAARKWHVFIKRTHSSDPDSRRAFTWHALCSRQNTRLEILDGPCDFKVTPPEPGARCQQCVSALDAIKAAPARATPTNITTHTDPAAARRHRLI